MREVVLDTETTGFDAVGGDRLVEIGCIELINHVPTNKSFWRYVNPERDVPQAAFQVHGLSAEFLSDKPKFAEVADALLEFVGDSPLIIHNAEFDMKFINVELERAGKPTIPFARAVDTVAMARKKFPGAPPPRPASMRSASASTSTIRTAACTARCSTRSCWPMSIWS